jgi:DNA polymerase-3 subunit gamma/tau
MEFDAMSYLVLARKYRPQLFADVVEQGHVTRTLANALTAGRVAHGILFSGPRGTGKTTVARILAKALNCQSGPSPEPCNRCRSCEEITTGHSVDVFEIDGASNNGVEQVRELRENVKYMPAHSRYKIYIIDEVHMLSMPAFNALLKTLEEPPAHVLFMFATTEPHKIPVTILSRCQRYDFRRIGLNDIARYLETICRKEGFEISPESLSRIAREAGGSIRDSLSLLDQVISCGPHAGDHEQVLDILGVVDRHQLHEMAGALLGRDVPRFLAALDEVYDRGHDMKKLYADLLEYFRDLVVVHTSSQPQKLLDRPAHEIELLRQQAGQAPLAFAHQVLELLFQEEAAIRLSPQPKLALEMVLFKVLETPGVLSIDTLIGRLDALRSEVQGSLPPPASRPPAPAGAPVLEPAAAPGAGRRPDRPAGDRHRPEETAAEPAAAGSGQLSPPDALWRQMLEIIGHDHPSLAANLKRGCLKSSAGGRIEIVVPENHFAAGVLRRDKNIEILRRVSTEILGRPQQVVIVSGQECSPDPGGKRQQHQHLIQQALNHPLVADSIEIFNGKLIDVQIMQEEDE